MPKFASGVPAWALILVLGLAAFLASMGAEAAQDNKVSCAAAGQLLPQKLRSGGGNAAGQQPDLVINQPCTVSQAGDYFYGNVNIVAGGSLTFVEPAGTGTQVNFWASNIIVESGGALIAGSTTTSYGSRGGVLDIYIYGKNQSIGDPAASPGQGALCYGQMVPGTIGPCGIPWSLWNDNGTSLQLLPGQGKLQDYFYQYGPLYGDEKCTDGSTWSDNGTCQTASAQVGYFGYKVLAVSYNGTLQLFGYKGTPLAAPTNVRGQRPRQDASATTACGEANPDANPRSTGCSWLRLAANLPVMKAGTTTAPNQLTLSRETGDKWWSAQDNVNTPNQVVVTTTDYLPGHSEALTISSLTGTTLSFTNAIAYPHNGTRYPVASRLGNNAIRFLQPKGPGGMDPDLIVQGAETRAAVALLTRSIRILSAGDLPGQTFQQASSLQANCPTGVKPPYCCFFGAHTVFRQGFARVQIQGVEFVDMGQGGKIGHYPVHFHMARRVPTDTFVKDSSINESMTRWIVLHSTQGVLLQRNVGYKSIGHGFYLENGTETDDKFYANIGIFARAAVKNPQNPRRVPGILAADANFSSNTPLPPDPFPYTTDYQHPSVFWITNGWNDFIGNMAAGAGACAPPTGSYRR